MMRILILVCLLFTFGKLFAAPDYIKMTDKITSKFAKDLRQEKKLFLTGYGGKMMDDVKEVSLDFDVIKHVTIEEARVLFIEVAEQYLDRINGHVPLRPFLRNYPFTINNLCLSIGFEDEKGKFQLDLAHVFYCQRTGHIVYSAYDLKEGMLRNIYEEPYEDAKQLVKKSSQTVEAK